MKDLKKKTIAGLGWSSAGNLINQVIKFVISIFLARILMPEDFGLMAMVIVFTSLAQVFMSFGFGSALIQDKKTTQLDFSSIFFLNVGIGFTLFIITFLFSDLVGQFYGESEVGKLLRYLSITFVISSFGIIPNVILTKEIKFQKVTSAETTSILLSGITAVILAYLDFGVYSLIFQSISASVFRTVIIFLLAGWLPTLAFSIASIKKYLSFSSNIFFLNIISQTLNELDTILIGKFYPAASLGVFNRAKTLRKYPLSIIAGGLNKVLYPSLSKIQNDNVRLTKYYSSLLHVLAFLVIPIMFTLIVVAKPLIILVLTEKWIEVVPIFQILCLVGFMIPIGGINSNIFLSKGKSGFVLKFETVKRIFFSLVIVASLPYGLQGMAIGMSIATSVTFIPNLYFPGKLIGFSMIKQLKIILPYLLIATMSALIAYTYHSSLNSFDLLLQILIPSIQIFILYIGLVFVLKLKGLELVKDNIVFPLIKKNIN
ncbi:MAG: hypothetical protein CMP59_00480 [Flavobacteriales bacterium]|nr:hypothetical protein [Flavobacteriales bacterium]